MRTELPKLWHVLCTKENCDTLSIWRGVSDQKYLIGKIVGICYPNRTGDNAKGHNPPDSISDGDYNFGERISFEEFKYLVLGEPKPEPEYEIY